MHDLGRVLVGIGIVLLVLGLLLLVFGRMGLGKMPGDIVVRRGNFTFYFPLATSILISLVVSFLLWLFRR